MNNGHKTHGLRRYTEARDGLRRYTEARDILETHPAPSNEDTIETSWMWAPIAPTTDEPGTFDWVAVVVISLLAGGMFAFLAFVLAPLVLSW